MTLKLATLDDYDRVETLLLNFHRSQHVPYGDVDLNKVRALFDKAVDPDNPDIILLLWEEDEQTQGLLAGHCTEVVLNTNRVASELAWWVEPSYRKGKAGPELIRAFEYWAGLRGCKFVHMIGLHNEYFPALDRYYKKLGFTSVESSYIKEV